MKAIKIDAKAQKIHNVEYTSVKDLYEHLGKHYKSDMWTCGLVFDNGDKLFVSGDSRGKGFSIGDDSFYGNGIILGFDTILENASDPNTSIAKLNESVKFQK